jgi:hypothetical protein
MATVSTTTGYSGTIGIARNRKQQQRRYQAQLSAALMERGNDPEQMGKDLMSEFAQTLSMRFGIEDKQSEAMMYRLGESVTWWLETRLAALVSEDDITAMSAGIGTGC